MLKVKNELGSNAVILEHHRLRDGVEVTAAIDNMSVPETASLSSGHGDDNYSSHTDLEETTTTSVDGKYHYYDAGKISVREDDVNNSKQGKAVMPNKLGRMMQASDSAIRSAISKMLEPDSSAILRSGNKDFIADVEPPLLANRVKYEKVSGRIDSQTSANRKIVDNKTNPAKIKLIRQLIKLDFSPAISQIVADTLLSEIEDNKMLLPQALALISNQIPIYKEDVTACGGTVALLGATGVGKTTTIVKIAARFALRHGKDQVALITTDNNRIAAAEQLRAYSNIMGFQFKVAQDDIELLDALNAFSDKALVLIDTAGMGPKDIKSSKFYDLFAGGITQIKNFLVMSATMHRSALEQSTKAFSDLKIDGSIITKLDETTSLGGPLSAAILNSLPVAFYSNGQQVPDDFHLARSHILMSRAVSVVNQFEELEDERINNQDKVGIETNVSL